MNKDNEMDRKKCVNNKRGKDWRKMERKKKEMMNG